ncbi:MAG: hypothetical protein JWQ37_3238 [Blastococcus sp.]|nr:hypothetical protein [Blastococcus sp.]
MTGQQGVLRARRISLVLGYFSKAFGASLLRSTWNLSAPGIKPSAVSGARSSRFSAESGTSSPTSATSGCRFIFHFDFVDTETGQTVLVSERQKAIRDRYEVTVPDSRLDFRVAASMAVALDALQSR